MALGYIVYKSIINSLKELLKKPGKLVLYILVLAFLVGMILLTIFTSTYVEDPAPMFWFAGILFALIAMFVVLAIIKGLSNGDEIFGMQDVNLLFVSPVSSRKVLLYGILRLAKVSFFAGFFILFQSSMLANFGVNFGGVLLSFFGFILSVIVLSIVSLLIYSITNGSSKRKAIVKVMAFVLFAPLVIFFGAQFLTTGDIFVALELLIQSPFLTFFPIAGWTASGITALLSGEMLIGFMFIAANVLLGVGLTAYILLSKLDYYEDTLVATETAFEKKRALAEGDMNAATATNKKVKVTRTGISGQGANALFYKHLRERFRQNRFAFLPIQTLAFIAGAAVFASFADDLLIILQIVMWIQVFLIGTGSGLKETYSHYIYMIPESSFRKILWSNMETVLETLVEGVLIFGIAGFISQTNVLVILACIVAYTLFSLFLLGVNYLFMRFTGANLSKGLLIFIYFLVVAILILPGLIPAIIVGSSIGDTTGILIGLLILSGWQLLVGLVCLALSKGVLHNCDMPSMKVK